MMPKLSLRKPDLSEGSDLEFVKQLYTESFPRNERRPWPDMYKLIEHDNKFELYLIVNMDDRRVGFITKWSLDRFCFIEHFAICPDHRDAGYGKVALETFLNNLSMPVLGEIELPNTSVAASRRKLFYEKIGFRVWDIDYKQPPYEAGFDPVPMLLITYGSIDLDADYDEIKNLLNTYIYQQ